MKDKPEILFKNDTLIALSKPSGLLSVPDRYRDDKLSAALWILGSQPEARPLHRLDMETSGVLLFCIQPDAFGWYSDQFENRTVSKLYHAIVEGRLLQPEGTIDSSLFTTTTGKVIVTKKGKEARTDWKGIERFQQHTLVEAIPFTGRTHQIRVHLSSIGHPVLCDVTYGSAGPFYLSTVKGKHKYRLGKDEEGEKPLFDRTALHASSLVVTDYTTKEKLSIQCPLPKDMTVVLNKLRQYSPLKSI